MNIVIIKGNLTRDPELKEVGETFVAEFGVAVNRRVKRGDNWEEQPEFIEMKCWGSRGEAICNNLSKGKQILVEGEYRTDRWEKDGEKKSKTFVHVKDFHFCGKKDE
jgi:single-strand DNA-binding protein